MLVNLESNTVTIGGETYVENKVYLNLMYAEIVGLAASNYGDTLWLLSSAFDYVKLNSGLIYHPETTVGMPIQLFPYNWYGQFQYDSFITLGSF